MTVDRSPPQLTDAQVREVLARDCGWCHLLELARAGRVDTERAVLAIRRAETLGEKAGRVVLAMVDAVFGP